MSSRRTWSRRLWAESERRADQDFKNHVITRNGEGHYRFGRPDTNSYAFWVLMTPGVLVVYGDCGECIWMKGEDWFRQVFSYKTPDLGYIAEKTSQDCIISEFQEDLVHDFKDRLRREAMELYKDAISDDEGEVETSLRKAAVANVKLV